jgi:hypothetical protein
VTETDETLVTSTCLCEVPPEPPDSQNPDPPPPAPVTVTIIVLTPLGLYQVPLEVQTCIDLTPAFVETASHVRFDPLVDNILLALPDGFGMRYADDPLILPSTLRLVTFRVPLAVTPPDDRVKPPIPPKSLIAPTFNCAIVS